MADPLGGSYYLESLTDEMERRIQEMVLRTEAAGLIGATGANIVQVIHQRIFTEIPVQSTEVQFVLQTRGPSHVEEVVEILTRRGYPARLARDAGPERNR